MTEPAWLEGAGDRTIHQLVQLEDAYRIDAIIVASAEVIDAQLFQFIKAQQGQINLGPDLDS